MDKYGEPDGLPHNDWRQYKVDLVYRNLRFSEDSMNPMMDVREHPQKANAPKYEVIANEFLGEKLRKISSGPPQVEPQFKKDETIFIPKAASKHIFSDKKWHNHDHFVIIESVDKRNNQYNIRLFAPFATVESISMKKLHKYGKSIYILDCEKMKENINRPLKNGLSFVEELVQKILHPMRVELYMTKYNYDLLDDCYVE